MSFHQQILALLVAVLAVLFAAAPAIAFETVAVSRWTEALDLKPAVELRLLQGESIRISTAPDQDGIVRRVEVRSKKEEGVSNWAIFAIANESNEQLDRLIVAPHYKMAGSGLFWPDLDSVRISSITPSEGFSLETIEDREADVFLITLDPGAVITLVAELEKGDLPALYLWDRDSYKDTVNSYTLYRGIVLGISGLLAVFLTILFVVKGSAIFPATAALAWGVLAYVCVDFGFWDRVISITSTSEPVWRAGAEVFLAAAMLIFLYAYLNLNRWHGHFSTVAIAWLLGLMLLIGVSVILPEVASGVARVSFAATGLAGAGMIVFMAMRGFDRAVMLIPTWILMLAWLAGGWLTVTGQINNDIIQPALAGGLVLIVMLLGFTVIQYAFQGGTLVEGLISDVERQALALAGSGDILWDWDADRDVIHTGPEAAVILGLGENTLTGSVQHWASYVHPNDRDRFKATLEAMADHRRGRILITMRLRADSGHYHWFRLKARPMLDNGGNLIRCVGTIADVTDTKNAEERLLHDSVHDSLTGLENSQIFVNRLETVIAMARQNDGNRPSVFHINLDEFSSINSKLGIGVGDTILLTAARRLGRLLRNGDTLARLSGDQFVLMLMSDTSPEKIATFADSIRRTLKAPLSFAGEEIKLTASIGISTLASDHVNARDLMRDAELAMIQAKRFGGNRIEPFRPAFRTGKDEATILQEDLQQAIEKEQIFTVYQPIVGLKDRQIAGFETLVRWRHPKLGMVSPADFIPVAERSGMINELSMHVLNIAARDVKRFRNAIGHDDIFVSVNLSSRELLRHDLIADISAILEKFDLDPAMLKMELTESMVMENPESSADVLHRIRSLGVGLSMDDFGVGYSSLSYLLRFPFDTIKIDKSFVQARDRRERFVVLRSMVAMAHGLDRKVVAEGVEAESDIADLVQLGCEYGQGFLFGEATDARSAIELITEEFRLAGQ